MAKRLIAVARGFAYPVGKHLTLVRDAGGLSKLTPSQRASVRFKTVDIGGDCSDMPAAAVTRYLASGDIAVVEEGED